MSARSPQEAQNERQEGPGGLPSLPGAIFERFCRYFRCLYRPFFCVDILGFSWAHAMLEAIPPQSGRARARSARARAHPRLSNIAGARLGFLLLLLRCCLEMFETFSRYGTRPKRSQLKPPGEPAQRASKGISDPTGLLC